MNEIGSQKDYNVSHATRLKYFRSIIQLDCEIEGNIHHTIKAEWVKLQSALGVIFVNKLLHEVYLL
ncbi:hypothetical protein Lal_00012121 [Lupinus albus]|nr:hypothetical protein Lal_00012121 [Lupinus albus]